MLKKLTKRVYYMPNRNEGDRPLLGLVVGDKCSLIIDSGNSKEHAEEFLNEISKLNIPKVKYVFLTHWHWDHIFGLAYMNFTSICHEKTNKILLEMENYKWDDKSIEDRVNRGIEIKFCADNINLENPNRDNIKIKSCDISFSKDMFVNLGGVTCKIVNVEGNHTEDSSVLYVEEEKVLFMGDCYAEDLYSGPWSYSKSLLYPLIDKINNFNADYFLQSHCSPLNKEEMKENFNMMIKIGNLVGDSKDKNKCILNFEDQYKRKPNEEENYIINSFINGNYKK